MIAASPSLLRTTTPVSMYPACAMLEYARSRFRLFCHTATRLPIVIERTASIATRSTQWNPCSVAQVPAGSAAAPASINVTLKNRIIIAKPPAFDATERNAVIVIGAPS